MPFLYACPGSPPPPAPEQGLKLDERFNTTPFLNYVADIPTFRDDFEGPDFRANWLIDRQTGPVEIRQQGGALVMAGTATEQDPLLDAKVRSSKSFAPTDFEAQARVRADVSSPPNPSADGWYFLNFWIHGGTSDIHAGIACFQGVSGDPSGLLVNASCNPVTGPTGDPNLSQPVRPFLGEILTFQIAYSAATQTATIAVPELRYRVEGIPTGAVQPNLAINFELSAGGQFFPGQSFEVQWLDFQTNLGGGNGWVASRSVFEANGVSYSGIPEGGPGPVYVTQAGFIAVGADGTFVPGLTGEEDLHAYLISASFVDAGITMHLTMFSPFTREQLFQLLPVQPGLEIVVDAEFPSVWQSQGAGRSYVFVMPQTGDPLPTAPELVTVPFGFTNPGFIKPVATTGLWHEDFDDGNEWEDEWFPNPVSVVPSGIPAPSGTQAPFSEPDPNALQTGTAIQSAGKLYTEAVTGMSWLLSKRLFHPRGSIVRIEVRIERLKRGAFFFGFTGRREVLVACGKAEGDVEIIEGMGRRSEHVRLLACRMGPLVSTPSQAVDVVVEDAPLEANFVIDIDLNGNPDDDSTYGETEDVWIKVSAREGQRVIGLFERTFPAPLLEDPGVPTRLNLGVLGVDLGGVAWDKLETNLELPQYEYHASVTPLALGGVAYDQAYEAIPAQLLTFFPQAQGAMVPGGLQELLFQIIAKLAGLRPGPTKAVLFLDLSTPPAAVVPGSFLAGGVAINRDNSFISAADGSRNFHAFLVRIPPNERKATFYAAIDLPPEFPLPSDEPLLLINSTAGTGELAALDAIVLNVFQAPSDPGKGYKFRLPSGPQSVAAVAVPPQVVFEIPDSFPEERRSVSFPVVCLYADQRARIAMPEGRLGESFFELDPQLREALLHLSFPQSCGVQTTFTSTSPEVAEIVKSEDILAPILVAKQPGETRITAAFDGVSNESVVRIVRLPDPRLPRPTEVSDPDVIQFLSFHPNSFVSGIHSTLTGRLDIRVRPGFPIQFESPLITCGPTTISGQARQAVPPPDLGDPALCDNLSPFLDAFAAHIRSDSLNELLGLGSSLSLSAPSVLILPPGAFHFSRVSLSGQAIVRASETTTVLVEGELSLSGRSRIEGGTWIVRPGEGGSGGVKLSGNAVAAATIIAPEAPLTLTGNASLDGAALMGQLTATGNASVAPLNAPIVVRLGVGVSGGLLRVRSTYSYRPVDFGPFGTSTPTLGDVIKSVQLEIPLPDPPDPGPDGFLRMSLPFFFDARGGNCATPGLPQNCQSGPSLNSGSYRMDILLEYVLSNSPEPGPSADEISLATMRIDDGLLRVDNTPPTVTPLSPVSGMVQNIPRAFVVGFSNDPLSISFVKHSPGGQPPAPPAPQDIPSGMGLLIVASMTDALGLEEENNKIALTAADSLGNTRTATQTVWVDTEPPNALIPLQEDPIVTSADEVPVSFTLLDGGAGIVASTVSLLRQAAAESEPLVIEPSCESTSDVMSPVGLPPLLGCVATVPLVEGTNAIRVGVFDQAGNGGSAAFTVKRDTIPPFPTILVTGRFIDLVQLHPLEGKPRKKISFFLPFNDEQCASVDSCDTIPFDPTGWACVSSDPTALGQVIDPEPFGHTVEFEMTLIDNPEPDPGETDPDLIPPPDVTLRGRAIVPRQGLIGPMQSGIDLQSGRFKIQGRDFFITETTGTFFRAAYKIKEECGRPPLTAEFRDHAGNVGTSEGRPLNTGGRAPTLDLEILTPVDGSHRESTSVAFEVAMRDASGLCPLVCPVKPATLTVLLDGGPTFGPLTLADAFRFIPGKAVAGPFDIPPGLHELIVRGTGLDGGITGDHSFFAIDADKTLEVLRLATEPDHFHETTLPDLLRALDAIKGDPDHFADNLQEVVARLLKVAERRESFDTFTRIGALEAISVIGWRIQDSPEYANIVSVLSNLLVNDPSVLVRVTVATVMGNLRDTTFSSTLSSVANSTGVDTAVRVASNRAYGKINGTSAVSGGIQLAARRGFRRAPSESIFSAFSPKGQLLNDFARYVQRLAFSNIPEPFPNKELALFLDTEPPGYSARLLIDDLILKVCRNPKPQGLIAIDDRLPDPNCPNGWQDLSAPGPFEITGPADWKPAEAGGHSNWMISSRDMLVLTFDMTLPSGPAPTRVELHPMRLSFWNKPVPATEESTAAYGGDSGRHSYELRHFPEMRKVFILRDGGLLGSRIYTHEGTVETSRMTSTPMR